MSDPASTLPDLDPALASRLRRRLRETAAGAGSGLSVPELADRLAREMSIEHLDQRLIRELVARELTS